MKNILHNIMTAAVCLLFFPQFYVTPQRIVKTRLYFIQDVLDLCSHPTGMSPINAEVLN